MKNTWKALIACAMLTSGILLVGCTASDADAGPTNNGGAEVSEETKSRLQTATDGQGGGGSGPSSDTSQAAPPPTGE